MTTFGPFGSIGCQLWSIVVLALSGSRGSLSGESLGPIASTIRRLLEVGAVMCGYSETGLFRGSSRPNFLRLARVETLSIRTNQANKPERC